MSDHPGAQDVLGGAKLCSRCQQRLPLNSFTPNPRFSSGWDSWCRGCRAELSARLGAKRKFDPVTSLLIHHWRSARR
jgi:hypothetical protein